ncbi:hypothetical protein BH11PLA1_BH11PLA1_07660 [soil metagenome]
MLPKVLFLILGLGATAAALLTMRQQRLDIVHQMAVIHARILENDKAVFDVRTQIARALEPAHVEKLALNIGPMRPLGIDPAALGVPDTTIRVASGTGARPGTPPPANSDPSVAVDTRPRRR